MYVDSSALYALPVADDPAHGRAITTFRHLQASDTDLLTTSYVLLETAALLQARIGSDAVRALHEQLHPLLEIVWVDAELHHAAMSALLAAGRRTVALVDWVGFTVMRRRGIDTAFALDNNFRLQGFHLIPDG